MSGLFDAHSRRHRGFEGALSGVGTPPVARAREEYAHDLPRPRLQCLENGVQSIDKPGHSTTTASDTSRFCRSQSFSVQMKKTTWACSSSLPVCLPTNGTSNSTPFASVALASGRPSFCLGSSSAGPAETVTETGASGDTCASLRGTTVTLACPLSPRFTLSGDWLVSIRYAFAASAWTSPCASPGSATAKA